MESLLEAIANHPLTALSAWTMTFIALLVSIVVPIVQKRRKILGLTFHPEYTISRDITKNETGYIISFGVKINRLSRTSVWDDMSSDILNAERIFNDKEQINQVTKTTVRIHNAGNTRIEDKDIFKGFEITITPIQLGLRKIQQIEILDARLVNESNGHIHGSAKIKDNSIEINFNVLQEKEWFIVDIYHTGDERSIFVISGDIMGGKIIEYTK